MFSQEEHNSHLITEIYYRPELSVYAFTYFYTLQSVQKHTTYYNKKIHIQVPFLIISSGNRKYVLNRFEIGQFICFTSIAEN